MLVTSSLLSVSQPHTQRALTVTQNSTDTGSPTSSSSSTSRISASAVASSIAALAVARTVGKDTQTLVYLLSYSFCRSTDMGHVPVISCTSYMYNLFIVVHLMYTLYSRDGHICDVIVIYNNCLHSNTYPNWGCGN